MGVSEPKLLICIMEKRIRAFGAAEGVGEMFGFGFVFVLFCVFNRLENCINRLGSTNGSQPPWGGKCHPQASPSYPVSLTTAKTSKSHGPPFHRGQN